jgi:hypothetical protein
LELAGLSASPDLEEMEEADYETEELLDRLMNGRCDVTGY